jgi:hypothetical protein
MLSVSPFESPIIISAGVGCIVVVSTAAPTLLIIEA